MAVEDEIKSGAFNNDPVALTVGLERHVSGASPAVLAYTIERCKVLPRPEYLWDGRRLIVPSDGLYQVSLTFVSDVEDGSTNDDIYVDVQMREPGAPDYRAIGFRAWKPQPQARGTASFSGVLKLRGNTLVQTSVASGGNNAKRFLRTCDFSIAKVA